MPGHYDATWRKLELYYSDEHLSRIASARDASGANVLPVDSLRWARTQEGYEHFPLVVARGGATGHDITERDLPGWDFAIVLLFNDVLLSASDAGGALLEVDLRDQSWGIYNNRGKKYLSLRYMQAEHERDEAKRLADKLHAFLLDPTRTDGPLQCRMGNTPLRWASGGFLPLVRHDGRWWFALFARDIKPFGLNVANGASESKEEYKDIDHLIEREFIEEFVVLDPRSNRARRLQLVDEGSNAQEQAEADARDLMGKHFSLRCDEDHLDISLDPAAEASIEVHSVKGTSEVRVLYDEDGRIGRETCKDVFLAVNPLEFGIECIRIGRFELPAGHIIIDGETRVDFVEDGNRHQLVRRPVVLLSLAFIRRTWEETQRQGLGRDVVDDPNRQDCRLLPPMAHGRDYHMFDFDVRNRERLLEVQGPTWREADVERERLWLGRFAKALEGNADEHLRTLCPVTWKVMELALRSGVLRRYVDDGEDDLVQPTHVRDMTKCFVGPAFRRHAEASSVGEPTEPAAPEVFRERQLKTHCGYLLHVQEARRAVAHGHWDDFVEACERHMALARPAVKNAGLGLDLELLLQAAREESPDWSERADSLRADARGQGPWVKGPPRHLLGLMGLTVEDPDTCAWALQFLRTDYGLDFTAVAGAIGRLKANLTEHSEPEGGDPTQQAVHCALFLREDGLEIDLRLCFIDPTTPRSQIRSEDVYHAEGTLQEVLQDLEGYARFSVVFRVPDGPNEAEPQVLPPPERVPAALDALWWCGDAGAPSRFFAFVLDLPFPMSDGTIGTWQKQAGAPLLVPLSLSTQSET